MGVGSSVLGFPRGIARAGVAAALSFWLLTGCTPAPEPDGRAQEPSTDVRDLQAPPSAEAVLPDDRGAPPDTLQIEDLVVGDGARVADGDLVVVEYLGLRWSDAEPFGSTWDVADPFRFELGAGTVIPGWEQGLVGTGSEDGAVRVGGRRVITIPPDLGYGDRGSGTDIPPGETLVFVVDVVDVVDMSDAPDVFEGSDDA